MTTEIETFIVDFVKALRENNAVVFAGAGMSVGSGHFDWKKLMKPIADRLELNIDDEYDLAALAQYFADDKGGKGELSQILVDEFYKAGITSSENHKILARLPIQIFWTTNFDSLIEDALEGQGKTPDVKRNQNDLSINLPRRDAIVYKMHGDKTDITNVVLTKHDYEDYYKTRELFANAFKADFVSRTMLFIGFSFTDPNLDYLISRIRTIQTQNKKPDYYFIREETEAGKLHRQKIRANSLKQYGLRPLWIKDYPEITEVLREIERNFLRTTILISGSASSYGEFWEAENRGLMFIHDLSKEVSREGYKIVSGFGLGVGSGVINGVLENMVERGNQNLDHYLILRPFPQYNTSSQSLQRIWSEYRNQFIPLAGIAIFIFGNKIKEGSVVSANGMIEEFEISVEHGLKVIPIGSTGFVAEELLNRVVEKFDTFYPDNVELLPDFKILGEKEIDPRIIIKTVIKIMRTLNK